MAGCEVAVRPGKGVMVAINHRLVNSVVNRCHMTGDGDIVVPSHSVSVIGTTDTPSRIRTTSTPRQRRWPR